MLLQERCGRRLRIKTEEIRTRTLPSPRIPNVEKAFRKIENQIAFDRKITSFVPDVAWMAGMAIAQKYVNSGTYSIPG